MAACDNGAAVVRCEDFCSVLSRHLELYLLEVVAKEDFLHSKQCTITKNISYCTCYMINKLIKINHIINIMTSPELIAVITR